MIKIEHVSQLQALAKELGVRPDWHEPDEQDVTAMVVNNGAQLDNAMGSRYEDCFEPNVVIVKDGINVAVVNLATLLAFACRTYDGMESLKVEPDPLIKVVDFLVETIQETMAADVKPTHERKKDLLARAKQLQAQLAKKGN